MRILPVIDLMGGVVVRGIGGRRHEYRPIVSRLISSCAPVDVACAFREHFGLSELYLADLDAIRGSDPDVALYQALRRDGFSLWIDAGVRDIGRAQRLATRDIEGIVIGLETIPGPDELTAACREWGERIVFSLDLKGGVPLGNLSSWRGCDSGTIAAEAVACGVKRLLVLDLLRVGEGGGLGTEALCATVAADYPHLELAAGGGVRGVADLRRLRDCGVRTALVASALHDGSLRRSDLDDLRAPFDRG